MLKLNVCWLFGCRWYLLSRWRHTGQDDVISETSGWKCFHCGKERTENWDW